MIDLSTRAVEAQQVDVRVEHDEKNVWQALSQIISFRVINGTSATEGAETVPQP
jgi:hypothetical protein